MPTLASDLRNKLERVVIQARDAAETGARGAIKELAVHHHEPYTHMKPAQRELRNHLRARARQLGDQQDRSSGRLAIDHLVGECAYEHWHRMLFARFLAENGLLIEPQEKIAISLEEAEELAAEVGQDVWVYASRCAQDMLPQIFRPDDPLLQITFATEHMLKLEKLLASLPAAVFTASDALGWVYQFWQSKKKDQVNASEVKIGADELPAVTQLFTEPYMVQFLLHNTLGAWWAGKQIADRRLPMADFQMEEECRKALALPGVTWDYLRFIRQDAADAGSANPKSEIRNSKSSWRPAAGTFDGWPKAAAELKVLDPCCGSGHFLVAALHHLVPIRMAEEGLSVAEAVDAVLRDNLHGLEIDERCCQIAAFALAFAAWTYPDAGGYRPLPELNIACTGIGPQSTQEQWVKLAEQSGIPMPSVGREAIKNGLLNLHRLFSQAPTLGSLINPAELPADLIAADYETIQPYLTAIRAVEKADDETRERAVAAAGMVKAADLLAGEYTLVITNVPYLGRGKQHELLMAHIERHYADGKADLATAFLLRCLEFCSKGGSTALVAPQNWLFLASYKNLRRTLLTRHLFAFAVRLGEHGFDSPAAAGAFVGLFGLSNISPTASTSFAGYEAAEERCAVEKADAIRAKPIAPISQAQQRKNPECRIVLAAGYDSTSERLSKFVAVAQGSSTGDDEKFTRSFWEVSNRSRWRWFLAAADSDPYSGRSSVWDWPDDSCELSSFGGARVQGLQAVGKTGFAIAGSRRICCGIYLGEYYNKALASVVPIDAKDAPAIWAFFESGEFEEEVRKLDQKLLVTPGTFGGVPFRAAHWRKVAADKYPDGLPEPESDDPTQWLFHGHPYEAEEDAMLHVAVARLLGYRWPAELDDKMRLSKRARGLAKKCGELAKFADNDGIVCMPAVRGEDPAAERLLRLLAVCDIEPGVDLDDWLRNGFFEEHCKLFHDRPFVWHIWDGRKRDGFHALVNYHKLAEGGGKGRRLLESLTYAYLGEWITRQRDGVSRGEGGAEDRLAAAVELQNRLKAIIDGEPPFDIFIRWKPLAEQPIGWEPDINDGVRSNIRPFLIGDLSAGRTGAGVLRWKPNLNWKKDRGKEPDRPKAEYPWFWNWDEQTPDFMGTGKEPDGNRHNDCHYTNKAKQAARDAAETKERKK